MDEFFAWPWRVYPAAAMVLAGVMLTVRGLQRQAAARRAPAGTMEKPIRMMLGLRLVLIGIPLIAIAAGWVFQQAWLFWIGVVVAGEETFETTMLLAALREGERAQALIARRTASRASPA